MLRLLNMTGGEEDREDDEEEFIKIMFKVSQCFHNNVKDSTWEVG